LSFSASTLEKPHAYPLVVNIIRLGVSRAWNADGGENDSPLIFWQMISHCRIVEKVRGIGVVFKTEDTGPGRFLSSRGTLLRRGI
jgi:hypothetical protein